MSGKEDAEQSPSVFATWRVRKERSNRPSDVKMFEGHKVSPGIRTLKRIRSSITDIGYLLFYK